MPSRPEGSAASAQSLPRSAVRRIVLRCAQTLVHCSELAEISAGRSPDRAAADILHALDAVEADARRLRQHLKHPTTPE